MSRGMTEKQQIRDLERQKAALIATVHELQQLVAALVAEPDTPTLRVLLSLLRETTGSN